MSDYPAPRLIEADAIRTLVDLTLLDPDPRTPDHDESVIAAAQIAYGWTKRLPDALGKPGPKAPKAKRRKADPPELVAARKVVRKRSGGYCEARIVDWCQGGAAHAHHVLRQSQGGKHTPENLVDLCYGCHLPAIHANVEWAQRHGLLRSPGGALTAPVAGCSLSCDVDHRPTADQT